MAQAQAPNEPNNGALVEALALGQNGNDNANDNANGNAAAGPGNAQQEAGQQNANNVSFEPFLHFLS